jgi:hypothetical protein
MRNLIYRYLNAVNLCTYTKKYETCNVLAYRLSVSGRKRQQRAPTKLSTPRISEGNALKNVAWRDKKGEKMSNSNANCHV